VPLAAQTNAAGVYTIEADPNHLPGAAALSGCGIAQRIQAQERNLPPTMPNWLHNRILRSQTQTQDSKAATHDAVLIRMPRPTSSPANHFRDEILEARSRISNRAIKMPGAYWLMKIPVGSGRCNERANGLAKILGRHDHAQKRAAVADGDPDRRQSSACRRLPQGFLKHPHWLRAGKALVTAAETGQSSDVECAYDAIVAALDEEGWLSIAENPLGNPIRRRQQTTVASHP